MKKYLILTLLTLCIQLNAQEYKVVQDDNISIVTNDEGVILYDAFTGWYSGKLEVDEEAHLYFVEPVPNTSITRRVYLCNPFPRQELYYSFLEPMPLGETSNGLAYRQRIDINPNTWSYVNNQEKKASTGVYEYDDLSWLGKWVIYPKNQ